MRRRLPVLLLAVSLATIATPVGAHTMDHPAPALTTGSTPLGTGLIAGGIEGTEWQLLATFADGNPHTDLDFFTQGEDLYAAVGTLAIGPNGGGQSILRLREGDEINPEFVSYAASASCLQASTGVTGLQHDVEVTPKGDVLFNTDHPTADRRDAQLVIDATDADGRCHDNGLMALPTQGLAPAAPNGGLEIIDIRDIDNPVELALTTHVGEAHTVNVDPKRPHIAIVSSSDFSSLDDDGEIVPGSSTSLFTIELVDLSSCLDLDPASSVMDRRAACVPVVYRVDWDPVWTRSTHDASAFGACHETEIYPNDLFTCAGLDGSVVLDLSGAFDDNGTPDDLLDDTVNGTPLPCATRASTSVTTPTSAMIVDCVVGEGDQDLSYAGWREIGSPMVDGIELVGFVPHGAGASSDVFDTGPQSDIQISHEAELTHSGEFLLVSDERGGGILPPNATCDPTELNATVGNGGIHAFRVDDLLTERTLDGDELTQYVRDEVYAQTPDGEPAIVIVPPRTPAPTFCTAHVFHQIPGQNRIFMAWYTQGVQVIDYVEHEDGSFEFIPIAYFVPENANNFDTDLMR